MNKYNGYSVSEIIDICKADDAENSIVIFNDLCVNKAKLSKGFIHLIVQIARWDLSVTKILVNPYDFENNLSLKFDSTKTCSKRGFTASIITDANVPTGFIVAVCDSDISDIPSRNFAIMDCA